MAHWISFDLDYVTGGCMSSENPFVCIKYCDGCGAESRAIGRGDAGLARPDAEELMDKMVGFLKSIAFTDCIVRDSHGDIVPYLSEGDVVLNFDEHTDDYFPGVGPDEPVTCANWVNIATERMGVTVHQVKLEYVPEDIPESRLFVAISRPYSSDIVDGQLLRLLLDLQIPVDLYGGP